MHKIKKNNYIQTLTLNKYKYKRHTYTQNEIWKNEKTTQHANNTCSVNRVIHKKTWIIDTWH